MSENVKWETNGLKGQFNYDNRKGLGALPYVPHTGGKATLFEMETIPFTFRFRSSKDILRAHT